MDLIGEIERHEMLRDQLIQKRELMTKEIGKIKHKLIVLNEQRRVQNR